MDLSFSLNQAAELQRRHYQESQKQQSFSKKCVCMCLSVHVQIKTHIHTCTQGNTSATVANGHRHGKRPAEKKHTKAINKRNRGHHCRESILEKKIQTTLETGNYLSQSKTKQLSYFCVSTLQVKSKKMIYLRSPFLF